MKKNKKKGSNVSFVISSVLFITFVIFLYVLINYKITTAESKDNSLTSLREQIIPIMSGNLTLTSVKVNQGLQTCLFFSGLLRKIGAGNRVLVQDSAGRNFSAYMSSSGEDLYVDRAGRSTTNFFRVYSSEEFPNLTLSTLSGCANLQEDSSGYSIGTSRTDSYVLKSKVLSLLINSSKDYEAVKRSVKLSPSDEFGFAFTYSNGTRVATPMNNLTTNVYSERISTEYVSYDSGISPGYIDLMVW